MRIDCTEEANRYAKEKGLDEPDWMRKIIVEAFNFAVNLGYERGYSEGRYNPLRSTVEGDNE